MHEYYKKNINRFKKEMNNYFKNISSEIEDIFGKSYDEVIKEIWEIYENTMLKKFPYIGGDDVGGTKNLTGVYYFIAFAITAKPYGLSTKKWGELSTTCYERFFEKKPAWIRKVAGYMMKFFAPKMLKKKDQKNALNASKNPGSFETQTLPSDSKYCIKFHNLVCPIYNFAKENGYEEYMPYMCNLDYVIYGSMGLALRREKVIADGDDYCDFKFLRKGKPVRNYPPHILDKKDKLK